MRSNSLMAGLRLLRNERAYRRWSLKEWAIYGSDKLILGRKDVMPQEYPCWGFTVCVDLGMEEFRPRYLYRDELERMLKEMD